MIKPILIAVRLHMWVSAKLGGHWLEIERIWHDAIDAQINHVFEPVEDEE